MSRAERWTDADLSDFAPDEESESAPNWDPLQDDAEKKRDRTIVCHVCDSEWRPEVGRVLGNNDDELDRGCLDCCTIRELNGNRARVGEGVGRDWRDFK